MDWNQYNKPTELDIRSLKQKGQELATAIEDEVKATQSAIIRSLPDRLRVTTAQAKQLLKLAGHIETEYSKAKLYRTKYNVMEVIIDGE